MLKFVFLTFVALGFGCLFSQTIQLIENNQLAFELPIQSNTEREYDRIPAFREAKPEHDLSDDSSQTKKPHD